MKKNISDIINTYLWYGYLPPNSFPNWINNIDTDKKTRNNYKLEEAIQVFDKLFDNLVSNYHNRKHTVLLSGGWDSRAILGALLERVDKSQIETVTYGVPGQLDFNIGIKVAKDLGINYHALDLRDINFKWDNILESVKNSPWTGVPDCLFNSYARNSFCNKENIIWIGYLGGLFKLRGSQLQKTKINDSERSTIFANKERRVSSIHLCHSEYSPSKSIPTITNLKSLSFDDALNLGIRQTRYIAPITLPIKSWEKWEDIVSKEENGAIVIAPYTDKDFVSYWLTAPDIKRKGQFLFQEIVHQKFPNLFSIPSKGDLGIHRQEKFRYYAKKYRLGITNRIQKVIPYHGITNKTTLNYLDYDEMFRTRKDYQETLKSAFDYLNKYDITPWLNLEKMWGNHVKRRNEYGDAFCVLIGLAANLINNPVNNSTNNENSVNTD